MFDISLYNDEFFQWHVDHAAEYQINTFLWYIEKYKPESVVDFGCGIGSYLQAAYSKRILKLKGLDISQDAGIYTPHQVRPFIEYIDCTTRIELPTTYDCVLSFETAEHIDPKGTDQFVDNIIRAANKHILFTAAPPGQDGCGHINMHRRDWWIDKFRLEVNEEMTKDISEAWFKIGCPEYISKNLIVFNK